MLRPKTMKPVYREMFRGDTVAIDLAVTDPKTQTPLNLTGATLWFTAKGNLALPDNMAAIALDNQTLGGITITDAVRGLATVVIPPIATRAYPDGPVKLSYDIQLKQATGEISTIEFGDIVVFPDATRAIA